MHKTQTQRYAVTTMMINAIECIKKSVWRANGQHVIYVNFVDQLANSVDEFGRHSYGHFELCAFQYGIFRFILFRLHKMQSFK